MQPVGLPELAGRRWSHRRDRVAGGLRLHPHEHRGGRGVAAEFADHHWYSADDIARLDARAAELDVEALITTEKDWVRLRRLRLPRRPVYVLSVRSWLQTGEPAWRQAFRRACP